MKWVQKFTDCIIECEKGMGQRHLTSCLSNLQYSCIDIYNILVYVR